MVNFISNSYVFVFIFPLSRTHVGILVICQSFLGFGQSADIFIDLEGSDKRKQIEVRNEEGRKEKLLLYYDGETVKGKVGGELNLSFKKLFCLSITYYVSNLC